jgi:hypothetical protein
MTVQDSSTHLLRGTQENLPYCKSSPITIGDFKWAALTVKVLNS